MDSSLSDWIDPKLAERLLQFPGNKKNLVRLIKMFSAEGDDRPLAFVGAGISAALFPDWPTLLGRLGGEALSEGMASENEIASILETAKENPLAAATQLSEKLGHQLFRKTVTATYSTPDQAFTPGHQILMRLPFKAYVTTNYDRCLEYARRAEYPDIPLPSPTSTHADTELLRRWLDKSVFDDVCPILHLHGSVDYPSSLILNETAYQGAYIKSDLSSRPFQRLFEQLWLQERLLILGFSGRDPMIRDMARRTLSQFKWPAADVGHIALIPLEPSNIHEAQAIRREFQECFHAGVVFFDPAARPSPYTDLQSLLSAVVAIHPGPSERRRRDQQRSDLAAYKTAVTLRLRQILEAIVPQTATTRSEIPIHKVFWIPTIEQVHDAGSSTVDARESLLIDASGASAAPDAQSDTSVRKSATTPLIVIYGEPGAGKSTLARTLALGLVEGTGLANVTDTLSDWLVNRDLPVLVDMRRYAEELVAQSGDRLGALRGCLATAWGASFERLFLTNTPSDRAVVIVDGLEALLWAVWPRTHGSDQQRRSVALRASAEVLATIRECFPDIPIVATARPFAERWLRDMGETPLAFNIAAFRTSDLEVVAGVHLIGRPTIPEGNPKLAALLRNRSLLRFASTPLFVKRALDAIATVDDVNQLTAQKVVGGYLDHVILRGVVGQEDALPAEIPLARDFLRALAYEIVASGGTALEPDNVVLCGKQVGLSRSEASLTIRWLGDRTGIIEAEPNGGLSFAHDWDLEYLAGEALARNTDTVAIASLATEDRWRQPVVYAAGLAHPAKAEAIIDELLNAGEIVHGVDAATAALRGLDEPTRERLTTRIRGLSPGTFETRLPLIGALTEINSPETRRLLLDTALPLSLLSTAQALQRICTLGDWKRENLENFIETVADRARRADHLTVVNFPGTDLLVVAYVDTEAVGGGWSSASILINDANPGAMRPKISPSASKIISTLITKLPDVAILGIAEAALALEVLPPQMILLALALCVEKWIFNRGENARDTVDTIGLLLRGLQKVHPRESPAFAAGLVNAVLNRLSDSCSPAQRTELLETRRKALIEYGTHMGRFLKCIEPDGYWHGPFDAPPDTLTPIDRVATRLQEALRSVAATPPTPSEAAPWQQRSLLDAEIARSGHLVHKLKAKDSSGRWAYYFVLVEPSVEKDFLAAIQGTGMVDLEDYGNVLASCYGEEPTQDIKRSLKERYGFNV